MEEAWTGPADERQDCKSRLGFVPRAGSVSLSLPLSFVLLQSSITASLVLSCAVCRLPPVPATGQVLLQLSLQVFLDKRIKSSASQKQHIPAALQVLLAEITGQETEKSCDRDSSCVDQGFRWVSHTHIFTESTALSSGAAGLIPTPILRHHFCCSRKLGIQNKPYFSSL